MCLLAATATQGKGIIALVDNITVSKVGGTEMETLRAKLTRRRTKEFFRDVLLLLVSAGHLKQEQKIMQVPGGKGGGRTYETFVITPQGFVTLRCGISVPVMLPIPESIRRFEAEQAEKIQQAKAIVKAAGVDPDTIPEEQFETSDGPQVKAILGCP